MRDRLFDFELIVPAPDSAGVQSGLLPFIDEALLPWLLRFSAASGLSVAERVVDDAIFEMIKTPDAWLYPGNDLLGALMQSTGVATERLARCALDRDRRDTLGGRARRFSREGHFVRYGKNPLRQSIAICPLCLSLDDIRYVRTSWMTGWMTVCLKHAQKLVDRCPACRKALVLPSIHSLDPFDPARCEKCGYDLLRRASQPAHANVMRLSERLCAAYRSGRFKLGDRNLPWATALALMRALLSIIWIIAGSRSRLFALMSESSDTGLRLEQAQTNHGGLVMLSWLFDQWPSRLGIAAAALDLPYDEILAAGFMTTEGEQLRSTIHSIIAPHWRIDAVELVPSLHLTGNGLEEVAA